MGIDLSGSFVNFLYENGNRCLSLPSTLVSKVSRLFPRSVSEPHSYILSRWLFLRLLGIVYFIAFFSFWVQLPGLIGSDGILPAEGFLEAVKVDLGKRAYWLVPTLAWFNSHDLFLESLALGGAILSFFLILGVLTMPVLAVLWGLYLSLVNVGQFFMSFQWDNLLLESGFLAIFISPLQVLPKPSRESPPSTTLLWLFRFLLFRLMFSSGFGKLTSGDPTWRNFTALDFHYYTQPLPNPIAWYMYQLPEWFHRLSVGFMFLIELVVPFFIFAPRRIRFIAGGATVLLQLLIMLTGNYTFFNLLTISLCVLLFDDAFLQRFFPRRLRDALGQKPSVSEPGYAGIYKRIGIGILAAIIVFLGCIQIGGVTIGFQNLHPVLQMAFIGVSPFRLVNGYGLFRVMTTFRPEIVIEGSDDGRRWLEYGFKYKPGDPRRSPPWVEPHQPRLDWQMWFAALGGYRNNPWFVNLVVRLLQGSPDVLRLLGENPFPKGPPRYVRALLYEYRFTDPDTKRATGKWWERKLKGVYFYPISLNGN